MMQATEIITPMAELTRYRLESDATTTTTATTEVVSEPECEIHACNERQELQKQLNNITSLRDLFVKQSQMLALIEPDDRGYDRCNDHDSVNSSICSDHELERMPSLDVPNHVGTKSSFEAFEDEINEMTDKFERSLMETVHETSPTSVTKLDVSGHAFLDGIQKYLDFDHDIDSTRFSTDESDSDIQAAINEIRKEASQMDIIMALDQLKTIEIELEVTTKALRDRSAEAEDLRTQLEEREERLSCLELERDLYKADASKLKEDLKTCVDRMFDISANAGSFLFPEETKAPPRGKTVRDQAILRPPTSFTGSTVPPIQSSSPIVRQSKRGRVKDVRSYPTNIPRHSRGGTSQKFASPSDTTNLHRLKSEEPLMEDAFPLLSTSFSRPIIRTSQTRSPSPSSSYSKDTRNPSFETSNRRRSYSEGMRTSCLVIRRMDDPEDANKDPRICGMFRRRQSKRTTAAKADDVAVMRNKIDQLHSMMRTSLQTSEKLRKRLAMISRYYEGVICKLQEQMVEIKTEKTKLRADMDSKVSCLDHEKRVSVLQLESQLRKREDEIRLLTAKLASTSSVT